MDQLKAILANTVQVVRDYPKSSIVLFVLGLIVGAIL